MDWGGQWTVAHLRSLHTGLTVIRSMEREVWGEDKGSPLFAPSNSLRKEE